MIGLNRGVAGPTADLEVTGSRRPEALVLAPAEQATAFVYSEAEVGDLGVGAPRGLAVGIVVVGHHHVVGAAAVLALEAGPGAAGAPPAVASATLASTA